MIKLGEKAKDTVSGFEGICVARTEWLNGCWRITLQPKVDKEGKCGDNVTFDEPQLKVIGKGVREGEHKTGGPMDYKPRQAKGPTR